MLPAIALGLLASMLAGSGAMLAIGVVHALPKTLHDAGDEGGERDRAVGSHFDFGRISERQNNG